MSVIIVGDIHAKEKLIYKQAQLKFLDWLHDNYKDDIIVQLGDFFDSSSINHGVVEEFIGIVKKFKEFHIISGNHDQSKRMNNILKSMKHQSNIYIYESDAEIKLENNRCLMLPYQSDCKYYEDLDGEYDFIFTHTTPKEAAFGGDFIDLSKLKGELVYGHIHVKAPNILGVPIITRNGEKNNPILKIKEDGSTEEIIPPVFFDIIDLEFGEEIPNKDYLYNIKNAPSVKSVYDKYPIFNVRDEGITILYKNDDENNIVLNKSENDLPKLYKTFCEEKEIEAAFIKEGVTSLNECIEI